jgi:hypothetical protein
MTRNVWNDEEFSVMETFGVARIEDDHRQATDPLGVVFENKRLRARFSQVFEE